MIFSLTKTLRVMCFFICISVNPISVLWRNQVFVVSTQIYISWLLPIGELTNQKTNQCNFNLNSYRICRLEEQHWGDGCRDKSTENSSNYPKSNCQADTLSRYGVFCISHFISDLLHYLVIWANLHGQSDSLKIVWQGWTPIREVICITISVFLLRFALHHVTTDLAGQGDKGRKGRLPSHDDTGILWGLNDNLFR